MPQDWKPYTRIASPGHLLEVRIADGGELYGHAENKGVALEGQWLCRNPENGHMWTCGDETMIALYKPLTNNDPNYTSLIERHHSIKKKDKHSSDDTKDKISSSYDPKEAGPLFFGDGGGKTGEQ